MFFSRVIRERASAAAACVEASVDAARVEDCKVVNLAIGLACRIRRSRNWCL